jgi:hypothetical protein
MALDLVPLDLGVPDLDPVLPDLVLVLVLVERRRAQLW